jgi:hypothetical protein
VNTANGSFTVHGCSSDHNWLPGIYNNEIEPYLRIFHYCHKDKGEDSVYRYDNPIQVWNPETFEAGYIILDDLEPIR